MKTENFTFPQPELEQVKGSIVLPVEMSLPPNQSSHLLKWELRDTPHRRSFVPARGEILDSVVLFAPVLFEEVHGTRRLARGAGGHERGPRKLSLSQQEQECRVPRICVIVLS